MTCFDEEPEHQPTKEEWEKAMSQKHIHDIIHLLRDSVRPPENDKLMQDAAKVLSRIPKAIDELVDMIDGGEECRGRDCQISRIIRLLEGEPF